MSASGPHAAIRKHSVDLPMGLSHRPPDESVVSSLHCMNDPQPEGHMASYIGRRKFLATLGVVAAWPLTARAQQPAMPVIGLVRTTTPEDSAPLIAAFRQGLGESGFVEGRNVAIEYRYALNQIDRLPGLMAELVERGVTILAATGGTISAR